MPLRGIFNKEVPLLARERLPESAPAVAGVNTTVAFTLCPAPSVRGVVSPVLKPVPVTVSCVMVAEAVPVLAIFTVCVSVVFSAELPNESVEGVAVMIALPGVCGTGVGEGDGEDGAPFDAERLPLPPQPVNISVLSASVKRNRAKRFAVVFDCFKGVAPAWIADNAFLHGPESLSGLLKHFAQRVSTNDGGEPNPWIRLLTGDSANDCQLLHHQYVKR